MMEERDYLMKEVFPALRSELRKYGIDFTEVDLRWGITEEDARQGRVIGICMDEIDRSRPYFLGILGDRYGWIPDADQLSEIYAEQSWHQKVSRMLEQKLSITEMEFHYGALDAGGEGVQAFFFLRKKPSGMQSPDSVNPSSHQLKRLRRVLKSSRVFPVVEFTGKEELGNLIREILLGTLLPDEQKSAPMDILTMNRLEQTIYMRRFLSHYFQAGNRIGKMDVWVSGKKPAVLYGPPGTGKTALLSQWVLKYLERGVKPFLIFHFVRAGTGSLGSIELVHRIIREINDIYVCSNDFDPATANPEKYFAQAFASVPADLPLIVILDGVEHLNRNPNFSPLYWLPTVIPPQIILLISTASEKIRDDLLGRNFQKITHRNLSVRAIESLTRQYLHSRGKQLPQPLLKKISLSPVTTNVSSLIALLEELILYGRYEGLEKRLDSYLEAESSMALMVRILMRMEQDYDPEGSSHIPFIWMFLSCSREGLSEQELMSLTGIPPLRWATLHAAMEPYLLRKNGLLGIADEAMHQAVRYRYFHFSDGLDPEARVEIFRGDPRIHYLKPGHVVLQIHERLADHFAQAGDWDRRKNELPFHLFHCGRHESLAKVLTEPIIVKKFLAEDPFQLNAYWQTLQAEGFDPVTFYQQKWMEAENYPGIEKHVLIAIAKNSATLLQHLLKIEAAGFFLEKQLQLEREGGKASDWQRAEQLIEAGNQFLLEGKPDEAEAITLQALELLLSIPAYRKLKLATAYETLAAVAEMRGDLDGKLMWLRRSLEFTSRVLGDENVSLVVPLMGMGDTYLKMNELEEAEEYLTKALSLLRKGFRDQHPLEAQLLDKYAVIKSRQGNTEDAKALLYKSLAIKKTHYTSDHPSLEFTHYLIFQLSRGGEI